jgi:3-deoxy-D-manno-octulosonic acid kinase
MILRLPRGYRRLEGITPLAVAHERFADTVTRLLAAGPLYQWAATHPERREYQGRGPVYSAPLPDGGPRVVVRHARRGGLLAPLLRDVYLPPTPAVSELLISAILVRGGVPTPPVLAFATYAVAGILRRLDVMTVEVEGSDLATALAQAASPGERQALHAPVARLLGAMLNAGAWHQDLNARNILLTTREQGQVLGLVVDVDRVRFAPPGDPHVRDANLARLRRSMEKFRARGAPAFDDGDFAEIERLMGTEEAARAQDRAATLGEHMPWE